MRTPTRSGLSWLLPEWTSDCRPDATHFHRRRFTKRYRRKRRLVRDMWIGACLLMVLNPILPFVLATVLATTIAAFMILDETT